MSRLRRAAAAAAAALVVLSVSGTPSWAADTVNQALAGFTVAGGPSGAVNLAPGSSTSVQYTVVNTGVAIETVAVHVTGLYFSGADPQFSGSPSSGLTAVADPPFVTLGPGQTGNVSLQLSVGQRALPGGLYGGVVFSDTPPQKPGEVTVVDAQARPIICHVPGPYTDSGKVVSFGRAQASPSGFMRMEADFLDTGNIDYPMWGTVSLDRANTHLASQSISSQLAFPARTRGIDVDFPDTALQGKTPITATLNLVYGTTGEHRATEQVVVMPPGARILPGAPPGAGLPAPAPTFIGRPLHGHHPSRVGLLLLAAADGAAILWALRLLLLFYRRHHDREGDPGHPPLAAASP